MNPAATATMLSNALFLNNEGVAFLSVGKPQEGMVRIKRALAVMNHILARDSDPSMTEETKPTNQLKMGDLSAMSSVPYLTNSDGEGKTGTGYHYFSSAMVLTIPFPAISPREEDLGFYVAAAMLNMALAVHQLAKMASSSVFGEQGKVRESSLLRKADRLYQSVQEVVEASLGQQSDQEARLHFPAVAALNNRLGIALEQMGAPTSTSVLQLKTGMDAMLTVLNSDSAFNGVFSEAQEECLAEFMLNSAVLDMTCMFAALSAPCA